MQKIKFILPVFLFLSFCLKGQEVRPIFENQVLKKYLSEKRNDSHLKSAKSIQISDSSLFDDFSELTFYPDPSKWQFSNSIFINATYPIDPVSFGVATLDAYDDKGNVYNVTENPTLCDQLLSIPLNLKAGSVYYLSFFFQPQGLGEAPEPQDSLIVEFYNAQSGLWHRIWDTTGNNYYPFTQKVIAVPDTFNHPGFQFRFRNYASFSANELIGGAGALSNFDQWHIDYVRFNNNPIDQHVNVYDVSIINIPASSFETYVSIPWSHVNEAIYQDLRHIMPLGIRMNNRPENISTAGTSVDRGIYIKDIKNNVDLLSLDLEGSAENLVFDSIHWRYDFFTSPLLFDNKDTGLIEIGAVINTTSENFTGNDSVKRIELYTNYYAYDDGSAEMGFGLSGESVIGSFLVQKFEIFKSDSLRRIDIYFNKVKNNVNIDNGFRLCVWNSVNGVPEALLYPDPDNPDENMIFFPDTVKSFEFSTYKLNRPVFVEGEIFIGIIQNTNEFINIGYDLNNSNKDKIYYNTTGTWLSAENAALPSGSLMIRPVLSIAPLVSGINPHFNDYLKLFVYPNPANMFINLNTGEPNLGKFNITIIDLNGKSVYSSVTEENQIDISLLNQGLYFIKVVSENGTQFLGRFSKVN